MPTEYPLKLRGVLTVLNEQQDCEFRATRTTGVSTQKEISSTKTSKLYQTTGERKPKMVAHLSVSADSSDPAADLQAQLDRLTRDIAPAKAPAPQRGRVLMTERNLHITLSKKERRIEATFGIDLAETPDYQNQLIKLMQRISTCLAINQTYLVPLRS